ncbi:MAG: hypothetical protein QHI38_03715 [Armatimonadota bacterium]|nr:hypothetical protein [Armatimonadota bacterium]
MKPITAAVQAVAFVLLVLHSAPAFAQEGSQPTQTPPQAASAPESSDKADVKRAGSPAQKPSVGAAKPMPKGASAAKPGQRRGGSSDTTEFELSAFTSEISDHFTGRINILRDNRFRRTWLRTGYTLGRSRTYSKTKVNETDLSTFTADLGFRLSQNGSYRFVRLAANYRTREPNLRDYPKKAGYSMLAVGVGRTLFSVLESEISLASVAKVNREGVTEKSVVPVYNFGLKIPLSADAALDGDLRFIEPFTDNPLADIRLNLTYKLTPTLSLRLSYLANNMLNNLLIPITSRPETDWDKSFRISLVFSKSGK